MYIELLMYMELLMHVELLIDAYGTINLYGNIQFDTLYNTKQTQRQEQEQKQHNHSLFHILIYLGYEVGEVRDHVEEARGIVSPDAVRENVN